MTTRMLIDASQSEETRVVVLHGNRLGDFDYDSDSKKQLKGNIYLAKVTRVEPSLQAAFVDYGGNRHGFLAFNEIHPDYYKIPVADRERLLADEAALDEAEESGEGEQVETVGGDELEDVERRRTSLRRRYKIQEVAKRGQVMLVQVVKEERGNKGAALTTYLSLPGRYCVLMPNTARGGGISRKIGNLPDRKRLKKILDDLGVPAGMAVIVRTAGSERTKAEIKRDSDYLIRLWSTIRNDTLRSNAPSIIYEEANLIKRAIRDLYTKDIDEILIEGESGYRAAKDFMRALMPSHAKRVQQFKNDGVPLFQRFQVENQIDAINNPEVKLRSGGYLVIHQTEALVAIDVNSGRATRERHIEETALKTNLEAADEVARQLRLRDLAGLIVIDYIDMEESRNNHMVERRLKEALRMDRARIQVGRISHFGLLEMSRQRLRPSLTEMSSETCRHCNGAGFIRSVEWSGLHVLRAIEEEALRGRATEISATMPGDAALYILNHKRARLSELEERYSLKIIVVADHNLVPPDFKIDIVRGAEGSTRSETVVTVTDNEDAEAEKGEPRRRRPKRRRPKEEDEPVSATATEMEPAETQTVAAEADAPEEEATARRRKRGRRGGRRRRRTPQDDATVAANANETGENGETAASAEPQTAPDAMDRADHVGETPALVETGEPDAIEKSDADGDTPEPVPEKKPRRRRTPRAEAAATDETPAKSSQAKRRRPPRPRKRAAEPANTETEAPAELVGVADVTEQPAAPMMTEAEPAALAAESPQETRVETRVETPVETPAAYGDTVTATPADSQSPEPTEPDKKRTGWWSRISG